MIRARFTCGEARKRSPTAVAVAERLFDVEAECAGLSADADAPLEAGALDRAAMIFVMEPRRKARLKRGFGRRIGGRKVISLDAPDRYGFMDDDLVSMREAKLSRHFARRR